MRTPFICANWKMHKTAAETRVFAKALLASLDGVTGVEVGIAPPFTALAAAAEAFANTPVQVVSQNVHPEAKGAFTGEIAIGMLAEFDIGWAIVGHSERRHVFGETDAFIADKVAALQAAGLRPILCIGEQLAEREAGQTFDVLARQLDGSLARADTAAARDLVVAYEPVWAIGTGKTATPEIAQEAHAFVRGWLTERYAAAGDAIRIQYGGSVKPDNALSLMTQPDIDGALVGGASLDPESFSAIIRPLGSPREA